MEEPKPGALLEDKKETSTDEAGHEKSERSHGEYEGGKEDQLEAINEFERNNDPENGEDIVVVNHETLLMETEVDADEDLEESEPGSENGETHNLPHQGSEEDEADENMAEDDEPVEEDFDDEDISEEEASEESGAGNDEGEGEEKRGQNPKEVKMLKLKNDKKSRKTGQQADKSMKAKSVDKPQPPRSIKGKAKVKSMGMIFLCSSKTKHDCFKYRVLGLPASKKDVVGKIYKGMRLFLYDVDLKLMYGIYKAAGPGGHNLEPKAFKSRFPSQVRYIVLGDCLPLAEEKFKKVIKKNYYTKNKFDCKLNSLQVKQLCKLFITSTKGQEQTTRPLRGGPKAAKLRPSARDRTRPVGKRRPDPRDEPDRPRKHARKILISPSPPPPVPYYAHERAPNADSYRRDIYSERERTYRDRPDPHLVRAHPYREERVPPRERREPLLSSYRVAREPYLEGYREGGRVSYLETRDPYAERRDPYLERIDPYIDGRVAPSYHPVTTRLDPYAPYADPYGALYRRDPYRDGGRVVEYRPAYGGGEAFDRVASRPFGVSAGSGGLGIGQQQQQLVLPREHTLYSSESLPGERPVYSSESLYSLSRDPLVRERHL